MSDPTVMRRLIRKARERDYVLCLTLYCESTDCPVREFHVYVKDTQEDLMRVLESRAVLTDLLGSNHVGIGCPVCTTVQITLLNIQTEIEWQSDQDEQAIRRVNALRWKRDHPTDSFIPAAALGNTELP